MRIGMMRSEAELFDFSILWNCVISEQHDKRIS